MFQLNLVYNFHPLNDIESKSRYVYMDMTCSRYDCNMIKRLLLNGLSYFPNCNDVEENL